MIKQIDTNEYREAWRKAERRSSISRFQVLGWGLGESVTPSDGESRKSDVIKALKKVARPREKAKPSAKSSKT